MGCARGTPDVSLACAITTDRRFLMAVMGNAVTGEKCYMARKPNYRFERIQRERAKAAKREERAKKKEEKAKKAKEETLEPEPPAEEETPEREPPAA